jgi:hypothetical protein
LSVRFLMCWDFIWVNSEHFKCQSEHVIYCCQICAPCLLSQLCVCAKNRITCYSAYFLLVTFGTNALHKILWIVVQSLGLLCRAPGRLCEISGFWRDVLEAFAFCDLTWHRLAAGYRYFGTIYQPIFKGLGLLDPRRWDWLAVLKHQYPAANVCSITFQKSERLKETSLKGATLIGR